MRTISSLLAAAVIVGTPGLAFADTPAPKQQAGPGQVADVPQKTSKHTITGLNANWGLDWFEVKFDATLKNAVLQVSTQAPSQNKQGVYSMGAAQPVYLIGTAAGTPDINDLALPGQKYAFGKRIEGLQQGTTYHVLITLPVGPGFKPVQVTGSVRTEMHGAHTITRRLTALDLDFAASGGSATVSVSTSPKVVGSTLKGAVPVVVKGKPQGGAYRFTHSFTNLKPGTKYYILAVVGSQKATQRLTETSTKTRQIDVVVEKIKIIDDADNGLRGKGELLFQVRGTTSPTKSGLWGTHYGETAIGSGDTVGLASSAKAPRHTFTTDQSTFTVQVEGRESDWVGKSARKRCEGYYRQPHEKHTARWLNSADSGAKCYQFSYAQALFDLAKGATQTKTFKVDRTPELRFEVTVRMTAKTV
jgi:hypothetical protein